MNRTALATLTTTALTTTALAQPEFYLMGNRGEGSYSRVTGLSRDGKIAVGHHEGSLIGSFTWSPTGGRSDVLDQGYFTNISRDGEAITGFGESPITHNTDVIRVVGGIATHLGAPAGFTYARGTAIGAQGKAIAGIAGYANADPRNYPLRWTESGGMERLTGPDLGNYSQAYDISDDGKTVVGIAGSLGGGTAGGFVWREGVGESLLTDCFMAEGVSADGRTVVGYGGGGVNEGAIRWTDGVPKYLGELPGWRAVATDVSDDGSVVIGRLSSIGAQSSFVWTQDTGMLFLKDYLVLQGVSIPSDFIMLGSTISGDGRSFGGYCGNDVFASGFVAVVPAPGVLPLLCVGMLPALVRRRRQYSGQHAS